MLVIFTLGLLLFYVLLLLLYSYGWFAQKEFLIEKNYSPKTRISVIVAARNEAENIERCVQSILSQRYPRHLFELIIVDDHSTDNTVELVCAIASENLKLISLNDFLSEGELVISYKKKALALGIAQSRGSLIVTTDADCWMGNQWLDCLAAIYEKEGPEMIVAPVKFSSDASLLQQFQSLDFMTMQGITVATVRLGLGIMCNGANLAFSRRAYDAVGGYEGINHLVSGDDYLLQLKIKKQFPKGVHYLKSPMAIVSTLPQSTWSNFIQQRIRWASKTGKYDDVKMTLILLSLYTFNCSLFLLGLVAIFDTVLLKTFLLVFIVKVFAELLFLLPVARFYGQTKQLIIFPLLQPLHILYIIVAGFLSRIGKFEWKNRSNIQS
jgi:cellulose synthase/poly-beta-1,6-N-acetylglucosamine synthase-like glycosyltransferase